MSARYPGSWPQLWLFTDERLGDELWRALRRLPPGGGVVFRHYSLSRTERNRLFVAVRRRAHARRQLVLSARALLPGADGVHGPGRAKPTGWPAHDEREARAGVRAGANVLFVSPVHPTRSHLGAPALGLCAAARIGRRLPVLRIALGGMDARRGRKARRHGFDGWAGIDAWDCPPGAGRDTVTP